MFFTYLRKELLGRKKQTTIIAIGVSLALTLVILISSITNGIKLSQTEALESVYGVGTDITVSQAATAPTDGATGGEKFTFGANDGATGTSTDTTALSQASLSLEQGTTAIADTSLSTIQDVNNVEAATAILMLNNNSFSGQVPKQSTDKTSTATAGARPTDSSATGSAPTGGPDGAGGSSFSIDRFSVAGISTGTTVGPMSSVNVEDGALFTIKDVTSNVAVLDSDYATSVELGVGDTIAIAGTDFTIVGLVSSSSSDSKTVTNVYIPLKVAQTLSTQEGMVTSVYVKASSATAISQVQADITAALPDVTVNTQASLASTVSSSLTSVSDTFNVFGFWISILALAAAFLLSILFTISGIVRRTRELGTLKSIGWRNSRIVTQITGEAVVQSFLGGILGIGFGIAAVYILNLISPTITASTEAATHGPGAATTVNSNVVLQAILSPDLLIYALIIAVVGGLLAGLVGAMKVTKLQPAEALRSI